MPFHSIAESIDSPGMHPSPAGSNGVGSACSTAVKATPLLLSLPLLHAIGGSLLRQQSLKSSPTIIAGAAKFITAATQITEPPPPKKSSLQLFVNLLHRPGSVKLLVPRDAITDVLYTTLQQKMGVCTSDSELGPHAGALLHFARKMLRPGSRLADYGLQNNFHVEKMGQLCGGGCASSIHSQTEDTHPRSESKLLLINQSVAREDQAKKLRVLIPGIPRFLSDLHKDEVISYCEMIDGEKERAQWGGEIDPTHEYEVFQHIDPTHEDLVQLEVGLAVLGGISVGKIRSRGADLDRHSCMRSAQH